MKNAAVLALLVTSTFAAAQPGPDQPPSEDCCTDTPALPPARPIATAPAPAPAPALAEPTDGGWQRPPGQRFLHGFRIGYMFLMNGDAKNRTPNDGDGDEMVTLKDKYGLKTPHMMLLGYEGFYRIVGHSWLNVLLVGNVTVAGLEQSKFIPAASGLIGFEFDRSFQFGVGVNVTPDEDAPTHAILAAGWTPRVGSIHTPVHFFFVPEPGVNGEKGNHRVGGTVGMTW